MYRSLLTLDDARLNETRNLMTCYNWQAVIYNNKKVSRLELQKVLDDMNSAFTPITLT